MELDYIIDLLAYRKQLQLQSSQTVLIYSDTMVIIQIMNGLQCSVWL